MCVIVHKPVNVGIPHRGTLIQCQQHNPHGMGFMVVLENKVIISKGYVSVDNMLKDINEVTNIKEKQLVIHFRQATHGDKTPGNCHPFPLSDKDDELTTTRIACAVGVAHNGVFSWAIDTKSPLSDTQLAIKNLFSKLTWDLLTHKLIKVKFDYLLACQKIIFLHESGDFIRYGHWDLIKGVYFSNTFFKYSQQSSFLEEYMGFANCTPLHRVKCEMCGLVDDLRFDTESRLYVCTQCYPYMPVLRKEGN